MRVLVDQRGGAADERAQKSPLDLESLGIGRVVGVEACDEGGGGSDDRSISATAPPRFARPGSNSRAAAETYARRISAAESVNPLSTTITSIHTGSRQAPSRSLLEGSARRDRQTSRQKRAET